MQIPAKLRLVMFAPDLLPMRGLLSFDMILNGFDVLKYFGWMVGNSYPIWLWKVSPSGTCPELRTTFESRLVGKAGGQSATLRAE